MLNICMGKISQSEKYFPKGLHTEFTILLMIVYMKGCLPAPDSQNEHCDLTLMLTYAEVTACRMVWIHHPEQLYSPVKVNVKQSLANTVSV